MHRDGNLRAKTVCPDIVPVAMRGAGLRCIWNRLVAERFGVTSLEYALMGAFIMAAIAASVGNYAASLGAMMMRGFGQIAAAL